MTKEGLFPKIIEKDINLENINIQFFSKWVEEKIAEILGFEDEIVIGFINNVLETSKAEKKKIPGKKFQLELTGFLEKKTPAFVEELWTLLLDAQDQSSGIPSVVIERKKREILEREERNSNRDEQPREARGEGVVPRERERERRRSPSPRRRDRDRRDRDRRDENRSRIYGRDRAGSRSRSRERRDRDRRRDRSRERDQGRRSLRGRSRSWSPERRRFSSHERHRRHRSPSDSEDSGVERGKGEEKAGSGEDDN